MIKTRLYLPFLFCLIIILSQACKKNSDTDVKQDQKSEIQKAKEYFNSTLDKKSKSSKMMIKDLSDNNMPVVDWDNASMKKGGVRVPIKFKEQIGYFIKGTKKMINANKATYLLVYEDRKFGYQIERVTTIPDSNFYNQHRNSTKFSGHVLIQNWEGKLIRIFEYKSGKSRRVKFEASSLQNAKESGSSVDNRASIASSQSCVYIGGYTSCIGSGGQQHCTTYPGTLVCFGGGGGGGGNWWEESGDGPGETGPVKDEYPSPDPGDYGGGYYPEPIMEIVNNVQDPCINNALNLALHNGATNAVKNLVSDFLIPGQIPDIEFNAFPFAPGSTTVASASPQRGDYKDFFISFNTDIMPYASNEYNVATIYHELLHVYLGYILPPPSLRQEDHQQIANEYLAVLSESLQSIFPNLSHSDAINLAWGGLEQTPSYSLLPDNRKLEIEKTNFSYKNMSGNNGEKKGTYCQ